MSAKGWIVAAGLAILAGCTSPVRQDVDDLLCRRSLNAFDALPVHEEAAGKMGASARPHDLMLTAAQQPKKGPTFVDRLQVNKDIPGADTPAIVIPRDKQEYKLMIEKVIQQYFPDVPKVQRDPDFPPGP